MKFDIITEEKGSPFLFYPNCMSYSHASSFIDTPFFTLNNYLINRKIKSSVGRDYSAYPKILNDILKNLLTKINISPKKVLEVGAGSKTDKLNFFLEENCEVFALDADGTSLHENIIKPRRKPSKGIKSFFIPYRIGEKDSIKYYGGDLGLINHVQSELKRKRFDLIFFYGSLFSLGSNSRSVEQSRHIDLLLELYGSNRSDLKEIFKYNFSLCTKLKNAKSMLNHNGNLLIISHQFTNYIDSSPELAMNSKETNMNLLSLLSSNKNRIKIFGLTKKYLRENFIKQGYNPDEIDKTFNAKLKLPKNCDLEERFNNLGSIDAIVISS